MKDLHSKAQSRLSELGIDKEHLFELKLNGSSVGAYPRIWGVRLGQVLNILWWDPEHEVYQTEANKNETRRKNRGPMKRSIPDNTTCPLGTAPATGERCPYCSVRRDGT